MDVRGRGKGALVSVVNRMLLDIDQRLAARGAEPNRVYPDIRSVAATPRASGRGPLGIALALAAIGGLAATWWALRDEASPGAPLQARAQAPAPAPVRATTAGSVRPAASTPAADEAAIEGRSLKLAALLSELHSAPPEAAPAAPVEPPLRAAPATALTQASVKPSIAMAARTQPPLRQVAADETVTAARGLWADGSRGAAVATLGEALAAAEATRNASATAELARELARLDIAENRAQAALELLKRLEGTLGGDADAWALRGNAEQRLALHHEAAASYLAALRLKPGQGRWMIGAAISLAADGKPAEAQAWVVQARARGAITPPIAAYLQQIGMDPR
jgi:MSHA biogenesis protein MshN